MARDDKRDNTQERKRARRSSLPDRRIRRIGHPGYSPTVTPFDQNPRFASSICFFPIRQEDEVEIDRGNGTVAVLLQVGMGRIEADLGC